MFFDLLEILYYLKIYSASWLNKKGKKGNPIEKEDFKTSLML